jgi:hypothetical protein
MQKNSLFPLAYDEISLVDSGAAQDADVLIYKAFAPASALGPKGSALTAAPKGQKPPPKGAKPPTMKNPCAKGTNATGAKKGKGKGASTRAKNFNPSKHPRNAKGQMAATSAASKKKNGKGGTTKAKLNAACKSKSVKKVFAVSNWDTDTIVRSKLERKATR